jgi:hypothetical protein
MEIVQIISQHKRIKKSKPVKPGFKRVEAVIREHGFLETRHIDIPNN